MHCDYIGWLIKAIHQRVKAGADTGLKGHGLTLSQGRVLGYLGRKGGEASQKAIENFLSVSHPTAVGLVSRLEQGGFVRCRRDPADRRNKLVTLTEKSWQIGRDMKTVFDEQNAKMLKDFSAQEAEQLQTMLKKVLRNLEQ